MPLANRWAVTRVTPRRAGRRRSPKTSCCPKSPIRCSSYLIEGSHVEPSAEGHRGSPGEMRGTSCPRYGQAPSTIEGLPSTLQLTGIGHQGQPPPGVQARCSYSGVAGHPSQGRPELRPNSRSQSIYKAPQAKVSSVLCSTFPRSEDGNAPREKINTSVGGKLPPDREGVIRAMEETQKTSP